MPTKNFSPISESPLTGCLTELKIDPDALIAEAQLCCPADFPGFDGHFPGEPILPAVLQLMAVRLLAETMQGVPLEAVAVERLKFKGIVQPAEVINVRLSLQEDPDLLRVDFTLKRESATVASGTLFFRPAAMGG